jgi:hypothetical protein
MGPLLVPTGSDFKSDRVENFYKDQNTLGDFKNGWLFHDRVVIVPRCGRLVLAGCAMSAHISSGINFKRYPMTSLAARQAKGMRESDGATEGDRLLAAICFDNAR